MPLKRVQVERQLRHKFHFVEAKGHSSDHVYLEKTVPGVGTIITKLSHSKSELRDPLINAMARQLRVNGGFFVEMIDCSKSETDFLQRISTPTNNQPT